MISLITNTAPQHPLTKVQYIHVIPDDWGPYVDIYAAYFNVAKRIPWLNVISPQEILHNWNHFARDPRNVIVFWPLIDPGPKSQRSAIVIQVYSEALDNNLSNLIPSHKDHWNKFLTHLKNLDGIAAHTPWMAETIALKISEYEDEPEFNVNIPTFTFPVGWDPLSTGLPRWKSAKHKHFVTWGSRVGRRELLLPFLQEKLGQRLTDVSGAFGRGLLGVLDNARASLYIAHSDVHSFSTWRLWQGLATSATTVAEPGDTWPFVENVHYIPIHKMSVNNSEEVANHLLELAHSTDLLNFIASTAYNDFGEAFTTERCVEDYLVPGTIKVLESVNR